MVQQVPYHLPSIPFVRLRFHLKAEKACTLPAYKGSLLRGAFGHALRRTVCVQGPKQTCESCMLRRQCVYTRLFEPFIEGEPPRFLRGLTTAPRPYIFVPIDRAGHYHPGDNLTFDLVLIGQAIDLYAFAIFAVSSMAETGLGKQRHRFFLQSVLWEEESSEDRGADGQPDWGWRPLYDGGTKQLTGSPTARNTPDSASAHTRPSPSTECTLHFLTSTRLKFRDTFTTDFTFRMLVFKMLRRVLELAHFHVPEAPVNWEFHDLLVAANDIAITQRELQWSDWTRRSNRQNTSMKMGGFIGKLRLHGPLSPFLPLLHTSEIVHVGKGTVFGNGEVEIVINHAQ